jgi:hypothetical protein
VSRRRLVPILCAALALLAPPAAAAAKTAPLACSPDAQLVSFSDALDKTTFDGADVGGLSALALTAKDRARALVDNQGTTPARLYDLTLRDPKVRGVTKLTRPDGTAYTGEDFDGEGLVALPDGSVLASSETEPSIRHFAKDGRELASLPVPDRFRVAPAGEATKNLALEGLGLSPDGDDLYAGMEGPLSGDGTTPDGAALLRLLHYKRTGDGFALAGQLGYRADLGLGISEVQVVDHDQLLVLERGFVAGVGNTVRVYQAFLAGADDVSDVASLAAPGVALLHKRLLVDLGKCPPAGATTPGTQANPLLDNVEGMAIGGTRKDGRRTLLLISDDNFGETQVTRLYELAVALRPEPELLARALYPATAYQPGPTSGTVKVDPANGVTPPFPGQPIPGISAAVVNGDGTFWGQPDNGFGTKDNSADFLLRIYRFAPDWRTKKGGGGKLLVKGFISLRDPDKRIPWPIVNGATPERLLTGADFDIESLQRTPDGTFWIGDEFGPFLLHVDKTGKLLEAPIGLPEVKSPQNPTLAAGEAPTIPASRGFEAMAMSRDGKTLYPILEGALSSDAAATLRRVYEFDVASRAYTGRGWSFHAGAANLLIGDAQVLGGRRIVFIERDDLQGAAAAVKVLHEVDLDAAPQADGTLATRPVLDLLRIRDPFGISAATGPAGGIGIGDPFSFPLQSFETIVPLGGERLLIANDNNFPGSNGRVPGRPDDLEAEILRVPGLE